MKKMKKIFAVSFFCLSVICLFFTESVFAQNYNPNQSIVSQGGCAGNKAPNCGWNDFTNLINTIVQFIVFFSASIAVLGFVYAGFTYLTSFGNSGKIEQAHHMFKMILIGLFFVLCGWLLIATILKTLGVEGSFSLINHNSVEIIQTP